MARTYLIFIFFFQSFFSGFAQTTPAASGSSSIERYFPVVDQIYQSYASENQIPGLVYGIVYKGKLVHTGSIGYSNLEQKIRADKNSAFRIASMTKSVLAMAIVKLRDEGKLRLDDPAHKYIPVLKEQKPASADAPDITIRHLLTHSAGFPEDNPWGDRQLAISDSQMIAMFKKGISFSNPPGIAYEYSNMGYAMLGYIVQKVSGKYYADYIREEIFAPLGMKDSYFEYDSVPRKKLAIGYRWVENNWVKQPMLHDGSYGAMGGMITSIEDFSKYLLLHLGAWPPSADQKDQLIRNSSLREMHNPWQFSALSPQYRYASGRLCPLVNAYGYGLRWTRDCEGRITVGHSGGLPGFGSNWMIMPEYGIGIISFGNHTYAPATRANTEVLDTLIRLASLKPDLKPVTAILQQRKEELIKFLPEWKNAEKSGIFAENFFEDNLMDELKKNTQTLFEKAGRIKSVGPLIAENNLRGHFLLEGDKLDLRIFITLSPENPPLIQEFQLSIQPRSNPPNP